MYAQQTSRVKSIATNTFYDLRTKYIDSIIYQCETYGLKIRSCRSLEAIYYVNQDLSRIIHSIKGTAPMYEIKFLDQICHQLQELVTNNHLAENINDLSYTDKIASFLDLIRATALIEKNYT